MKQYILLAIITLFSLSSRSQSVGVGTTTPDNSAQLDVTSTTKGMLVPRMNSSQIGLIPTPATGLMVYQTNGIQGFYYNAGIPASPVWKRVGEIAYPTSSLNTLAYTAGVHSFLVPAGVTIIYCEILGGGGGSGGIYTNGGSSYGGGGGGGGGYAAGYINVTPGETLTLTVGSGGAVGTDGNPTTTDGTAGTTTSIANSTLTLIAVSGGVGGKAATSGSAGIGGAGGTVTVYNAGAVLRSSAGATGGTSGNFGSGLWLKGNGGYATKMGEYNSFSSFAMYDYGDGQLANGFLKPSLGIGGGVANYSSNGYIYLYW